MMAPQRLYQRTAEACRQGLLSRLITGFLGILFLSTSAGMPVPIGPHPGPECGKRVAQRSSAADLVILDLPSPPAFPPTELGRAKARLDRIIHALQQRCNFDRCTERALEETLSIAGDPNRKSRKWYDRPTVLFLRRSTAIIGVLGVFLASGPTAYKLASLIPPEYVSHNTALVFGTSISAATLFILNRFAGAIEKVYMPKGEEKFIKFFGPGKNDPFSQITAVESEQPRVTRIRHFEQIKLALEVARLAAHALMNGNLEDATRYYASLALMMIDQYKLLHFNEHTLVRAIRHPPLPDPISKLDESQIVELLASVAQWIENADDEVIDPQNAGDRRRMIGASMGILLTWLVGVKRPVEVQPDSLQIVEEPYLEGPADNETDISVDRTAAPALIPAETRD
jgi:hypothetical protein